MDFVGASTDGKYAAVGFDFRSPHHPLIARKSWFLFDEEYVCLGTGISTREKFPVATTLNQCLLRDDVTISGDNQQTLIPKGESSFDQVDWVYQDGIGYVFPKPTSVNIKNSSASGSWYRINKQTDSPKEEINLDVFKIWLDHGEAPSDASYEYIIVPSTTVDELSKNSSKNNVSIISNTPELQAVYHQGLNMVQAVFYKAGELQVSDEIKMSSHNPGIVIVKFKDGEIDQITVSDPNRELGKYNLSVSGKVEQEAENFKSVWNENHKLSALSIDLPRGVYAGESTTIVLE
jgi:chondroitin AC lyase